jgi:hypothetical protein
MCFLACTTNSKFHKLQLCKSELYMQCLSQKEVCAILKPYSHFNDTNNLASSNSLKPDESLSCICRLILKCIYHATNYRCTTLFYKPREIETIYFYFFHCYVVVLHMFSPTLTITFPQKKNNYLFIVMEINMKATIVMFDVT